MASHMSVEIAGLCETHNYIFTNSYHYIIQPFSFHCSTCCMCLLHQLAQLRITTPYNHSHFTVQLVVCVYCINLLMVFRVLAYPQLLIHEGFSLPTTISSPTRECKFSSISIFYSSNFSTITSSPS